MTGQKILIAGAGIGGLTAASCLLKAGHDVEIYEQAAELGEVGAGIQLSANAMHVMNHLGLGDAISRLAVRPEAYIFRLFDTAEMIQRFPLSAEHERLHRAPYLQVHRADFHELLAAHARALRPDVIRLGKMVTEVDESDRAVEIRFADGTGARGDVLIGADGVKSVVRALVLGDVKATYTGDAAWRLTIPAERLPDGFLGQVMSVWMGPARHAVSYYIRAGALLNFVGIVETDEVSEESWTARFPWEKLKADFAGWHSDVQTIIDAVDRDQCYRWSLHTRPTIGNWSTPRVTILGDAAHATLPYLAQGAAMAVEDGAVLTRALDRTDSIADALQLYQRSRMDRTRRVVEQSMTNRTLFHLRSVEEIRAAFRGRDEGADRNTWLYSYDPLTVELA